MDFSAWSPSHTVIALFAIVAFVGQVAIYFYRTAQNDKKLDKQSEDIKQLGEMFFHALERHEQRIDKRFEEMNQRLASMDASIRQLNQNHIDHLTHHQHRVEDKD